MEKYSWKDTPHGDISVRYLGAEIGLANRPTQAFTIENQHRLDRQNEAHHLHQEYQQQIQSSRINQRKRF